MFEKTEIDFICDKLDSLLKRQNAIKNDLNDLQADFEQLCGWIRQNQNSPLYEQKNRQIRKIMRECIQKGFTYTQATDLTGDLTGEDPERIRIVYSQEKYEKTLLKKYSRIYLVRHLLKHRLPVAEIAKISEYNVNYVYELKRRINEPLTLYPDEKFAGKVIKRAKY